MPSVDRPVVLYRRWRLRDGVTTDLVADLVATRVVPHYRKLSEYVVLDLEAVDETTVLAIQRWPDRAALEETTRGAGFDAWWHDYLPILAEWDRFLVLEEEWESEVIIGRAAR